MNIFFDKNFLKSIPDKYIDKIDSKLDLICQYSVNQFRKSASCRKIKSCNGIYKFRFSLGDRIIFKYIAEGIYLISYATHDKQIKIAERYNKVKNGITTNIIKWSRHAISILLNGDADKNSKVAEDKLCETCQPADNQSDLFDIDAAYVEDEFDEIIDNKINNLIRDGILSDALEEVRELYLEQNNIDKAVFYDEIINVSEKRSFFVANSDKISCIEINKNINGGITRDNIKTAIDIIYSQAGVYLYPIFAVSVQNTGVYELFYLSTENKRSPNKNKEQVAFKIINEIGEITSWGNITLECLLYSIKTNRLVGNIWLDVYPESKTYTKKDYHGNIQHDLEKYGVAFNLKTTADVKSNRIFSNKKLIKTKQEIFADNLNFIFGK